MKGLLPPRLPKRSHKPKKAATEVAESTQSYGARAVCKGWLRQVPSGAENEGNRGQKGMSAFVENFATRERGGRLWNPQTGQFLLQPANWKIYTASIAFAKNCNANLRVTGAFQLYG